MMQRSLRTAGRCSVGKPLRPAPPTLRHLSAQLAGPGGPRPAAKSNHLEIGVAGAQHGRKPRGLFFAPAALARLFKMPVVAHHPQRPLPVDLFLQSPQGPFHWLTLFQLYFGQYSLTSFPMTLGSGPAFMAAVVPWSGREGYFPRRHCQPANCASGLVLAPALRARLPPGKTAPGWRRACCLEKP